MAWTQINSEENAIPVLFSEQNHALSDENNVASRCTGESRRRDVGRRTSKHMGHVSYPIRARFATTRKKKKTKGYPFVEITPKSRRAPPSQKFERVDDDVFSGRSGHLLLRAQL